MKGFAFFDVLLASFFCIVTIVLALQLVSGVIGARDSLGVFEAAAVSASVKLTSYCFDEGGVAFCDGNYVRSGVLDSRVLAGYSHSQFLLDFEEANNLTVKVGVNNDRKSGVFCVVRLLRVEGSFDEGRLQVCVE